MDLPFMMFYMLSTAYNLSRKQYDKGCVISTQFFDILAPTKKNGVIVKFR